jgi:carbonic anhydrase/acetyltransferase-like protein (isoleucine patch superfamily)
MTIYALGEARPVLPASGRYWIAPGAHVIGRVEMREDASLWYGAVARGDNDPIIIGARSNVQDGSVLHTDLGCPLTIGQDVTIGHQVMLHGCTIGDGSLIGIGSTVMNNARIGRFCIIGAHSLITEGKEIPDYSMVMGAPGKIIRTLEKDIEALLRASADHYVENWKRHRGELVQIG